MKTFSKSIAVLTALTALLAGLYWTPVAVFILGACAFILLVIDRGYANTIEWFGIKLLQEANRAREREQLIAFDQDGLKMRASAGWYPRRKTPLTRKVEA